MTHDDLIDLLFEVQGGYLSCRAAAKAIIDGFGLEAAYKNDEGYSRKTTMSSRCRYDVALSAMINENLGKMGYIFFKSKEEGEDWLKHSAKPWMFISGVVPWEVNYRIWDDRIYENTWQPYGE